MSMGIRAGTKKNGSPKFGMVVAASKTPVTLLMQQQNKERMTGAANKMRMRRATRSEDPQSESAPKDIPFLRSQLSTRVHNLTIMVQQQAEMMDRITAELAELQSATMNLEEEQAIRVAKVMEALGGPSFASSIKVPMPDSIREKLGLHKNTKIEAPEAGAIPEDVWKSTETLYNAIVQVLRVYSGMTAIEMLRYLEDNTNIRLTAKHIKSKYNRLLLMLKNMCRGRGPLNSFTNPKDGRSLVFKLRK